MLFIVCYTKKLCHVRYVKTATEGGSSTLVGGRGVVVSKRLVKMRKLCIGELILVHSSDSAADGRKWYIAEVIEDVDGGHYR